MAAAAAEVHSAPERPEDYLVDVWDTDSGLPHSTVTSLAQTPDGYLWVGTLHGGVARFDGVRFVSFYAGNTPGLDSVEVQRLFVDPQGTLWIGFVGGQQVSYRQGQFRYERNDEQTPGSWLNDLVASEPGHLLFSAHAGWLFEGCRHNGTNQWQTLFPPKANALSAFCKDGQGVVWYRTSDGGLAQYKDGQFRCLTTLPGLKGHAVNTLAKDPSQRIWVGTERELAVWDGQEFINMTPTNGPAELAVQQLAFSADGGVWVRTDTRLAKCRERTWLVEAKPWSGRFRSSPRPLQMFGDALGGVWVVHYGDGLWRVNMGGNVVHLGEQEGLPSGLVECWFQDREGNVWAGLSGGGLVRLRKRTFHLVWPTEMHRDRAARSVCEGTDGTMWFGTSGDTFLQWRDGAFRAFTPPPDTSGRDGVVCMDRAGQLWAGTVQNGVWVLKDDHFERPFAASAVGTVARALYADHAGRVWLGSEFGLYCWQTNVLKHFSTNEGFSAGYVLSIAEGAPGELWLGTARAELRHFQHGRFTCYHFPAAKAQDIRFWALWPETNGVVWIGTLGAGLLRFQDGRFTQYTGEAGLPNEHVSQILGDHRNQLWLGTRGGIARVSKEALEQYARGEIKTVPFVTYGKFDGLPSAECSAGCQPSCWIDHQDRLWFTTVKGAVWTRAGKLPYNPVPPPVHIEEVWVDGQRLKEAAQRLGSSAAQPGSPPELEIAAGQHHLEFHFTALSFTAPDRVQFRWQLEGMGSDWVDGGSRRSTSYGFLPPGRYRFHVQACNNDGVWNEAGDVLAFRVLPYFWQTWWFRGALSLGVLGVVALGYSLRLARLRALDRLRLRIARDLHDEVGANLGSITLLAQVMEKRPAAADAALIRGIATQTVDILRDIVWFIEPKHGHLSDLVTRLNETARTMLQGIPYEFESSGCSGTRTLPLEFRRNIVPIFKEALHNVLKHARATEVRLQVRCSGHVLELSIADNGQGFAPGTDFPGNGLNNMRRRTAEMQGELQICTQPGQGCTLRLRAPIPQTRDWK